MKKAIFLPMALVSGLLTSLFAEDLPDHDLSEWSLGPTLFGEEVSERDMKGKVVVIEHWGVRCPPCIAMLPHLVKMDKSYRDDGLLIVGAESQGHKEEQIQPLVDDHKINYTITSGARGPIRFNGIPHAFVFDVSGKLIFQGNPHADDFERVVKKALKDVEEEEEKSSFASSSNLFESRTWTNAEGNSLKAAVRSATETEVTFVMFGGKVVKYPLAKLSDESRREIEEAVAAQMTE
ncbi:MAG: TlpA family protein disulfide reductase [Verrucomicrobiales bacterium]